MITIQPDEAKQLKETYLKDELDFEKNVRLFASRPTDKTLLVKLAYISLEIFPNPIIKAKSLNVLIFRAIESVEYQIKSDDWLIKQACALRDELHSSVLERFPNYHNIDGSRWPQSLIKAVGTLLLKRGFPMDAARVFAYNQVYFPFWTCMIIHTLLKCLLLRVFIHIASGQKDDFRDVLRNDVKQVLAEVDDIQERYRWTDNFIALTDVGEIFFMIGSLTAWFKLSAHSDVANISQISNDFTYKVYNEFSLFKNPANWSQQPSGLLNLFPEPVPFASADIEAAKTKWRWRNANSGSQDICARDLVITGLQRQLHEHTCEIDRLRDTLLRIEETARCSNISGKS